MSNLDEFLANLDKAPQPEAAPEAATDPSPEAPAGPPDPYAHLIGHAGPIQEKSPFDAFLDSMEAPADLPAEDPKYEQHDWKTIQDAIFEDDHYVWRCQRCFRQVNVGRQETLEQACQKVNLNPNCGLQVAAEVMDT